MSKHTPGPWSVRGSTKYAGFGVNDASGRSVASFPSTMTRPPEEKEANASLIAAAPAMLDALRAALPRLEMFDIEGDATLLVGNAIAKAEGRL